MSILSSIALLGGIGAVGAVALNTVAKKFHVEEDARIAQIEEVLPGANCGACGYKGCHDFAVSCHKAGNLTGFLCPGAGAAGMKKIGAILGVDASAAVAKVAVVRCAGTPQTKTLLEAKYVGPQVCSIMNMSAGDYVCATSCLGCGDCVEACNFDAISIPAGSSTPIVNADRCTGCGMCAVACPRRVIDIRPKGENLVRVWVACGNCQKGGIARKECTVACIGCGLCAKNCPVQAITVSNNLASIDPAVCIACGKCVAVCPTHAIKTSQAINIEP